MERQFFILTVPKRRGTPTPRGDGGAQGSTRAAQEAEGEGENVAKAFIVIV